ncbi:MAG TPA: phosphoribosylamine--glycine ligase [Candidatus Andersenbacteria bacterium]|nr:phosphoribosylamine--glycine ligase [Candidatus Andersenbacteria bacterium]
MTRLLVLGSGGREAAIVRKLCQDSSVDTIFCAPGSKGILAMDERVQLCPNGDFNSLATFAKTNKIDLTIVGPEAPLVGGIVDFFNEKGLRIFGPTKAAARIEGSKAFCKELLHANKIPTAASAIFDEPTAAIEYIGKQEMPIVIKADGLAAGKGVVIAQTYDEAYAAINRIMVEHEFGKQAGEKVVVEEFLPGREVSFLAVCDGKNAMGFVPARDYKPVFDGGLGPNTGGMGCYAPVPDCTAPERDAIISKILFPTLKAMEQSGCPYKGVLYCGLMLTAEGPKVLEFNCRFGDPETQVLLELMNVDLLPYVQAATDGTLDQMRVLPGWHNEKAVCLVLTAPGYPGDYQKGLPIEGIEAAEALGLTVLHAGTDRSPDGSGWVTNGGRVINLISRKPTFAGAREHVYAGAKCIMFGGNKPQYRTDIVQGL